MPSTPVPDSTKTYQHQTTINFFFYPTFLQPDHIFPGEKNNMQRG